MANSCFKISKKVSIKRAGKNKPWFNWFNWKTVEQPSVKSAELHEQHQTRVTVPFWERTTAILRNFMKVWSAADIKKSFFDKINRDIEEGKILERA